MVELSQITPALDFFTKILPYLPAVAAIMIIYILWQRTGSLYMVMVRLWAVIAGNAECEVPIVKQALNERAAIMRFRFTTGIQIRSVREIESLVKWSKDNDEDLGAISDCGKDFNVRSPSTPPASWSHSNKSMLAMLVLIVLLIVSTVFSFTFTLFDKPILRFKETGTWFVLSDLRAQPLFGGAGLPLENCKATAPDRYLDSGFAPKEIADICGTIANIETRHYLNASVPAQRTMFLVIAIFLAFFSRGVWKFFAQKSAVRAMRARLSSP